MAAADVNGNGAGKRSQGQMLWVLGPGSSTSRSQVEESARSFGMTVRFCDSQGFEDGLRASRAQIVAYEFGPDQQESLRQIGEIHSSLPHLVILAATLDNGIDSMRSALNAGASDVLTLPVSSSELHKALLKATQLRAQRAISTQVDGEVIAVYGARGGLGTTTLVVNIAVCIANLTEQRTAVLDLDLQRGDVATFLNLTPSQSLSSFSQPAAEFDDMFLQGALTRHPSNVFVLPAPPDIEEAEIIGRTQVARALGLMRSEFKYTVIDTPRSFTEPLMAAFESADRILVLTDLTIPGVRAGQRAVDLLTRLDVNPEKIQLILTELCKSEIKQDEATKAIGRSALFTLPRDVQVATEAMNAGTPIDMSRDSPLAKAINDLVSKITGAKPRAAASPLLKRLFGLGRNAST